MESTKSIREGLPDPHSTIMDCEIWKRDSEELHELAETIVNRSPRFAWMIIEAWLTKYGQQLVDKK